MLSCTSKAPGPPLWLRKTIRPPSGEFKLGSPAEGAGWKRGGADRRACFRAGEQPIIRASQGRGDSKELGQLPNVNADRTMNSRILGHPEVGRRQTGYPRSVADRKSTRLNSSHRCISY